MNHLIYITKSDGTRQLFEEEKLINSLRRVGAAPEVIDDIVERVGGEISDGMSTADIYGRAFDLLKKHSLPIAIKYSIRRALIELGPDGFPFERFVARIFETWGYETSTDQIVRGGCVEHEIDVVAWKGEELAMVEAKFHNEFTLRSDLKVALYVWARFQDLMTAKFNYGGVQRRLTDPWLITNTKFTDRAITYGSCHLLKMVGWNYPDKPGPGTPGNLHQIIEKNGLHPVTCLTSITRDQKKQLIAAGVLVCKDLANNLEAFKAARIPDTDVARILNEAKEIIDTAR